MSRSWRHAVLAIGAAAALVGAVLPAVGAGGAAPVNPILNGEFELSTPRAVFDQLTGTPADECIGIGHQVFYGEDTPQAGLVGAAAATLAGNDTARDENVSQTMGYANSSESLQDQALLQSGYGHCVWSQEEGYDLAWINPVEKTRDEAVAWSAEPDDDERTVSFGDFQGDGDREAMFVQKPNGSGHNMWQSWLSQNQAFTADFDALEFDVESGTIPSNAKIQVSLSATPWNNQTKELVVYRDCALNFRGGDLASTLEDGRVSMPPVDAGFSHTDDPDCIDLADQWENGTDEERRDILGRLRIVQFSFWGFQNEGPLVVDDVALTQTPTAAEGAAHAQANPESPPETAASPVEGSQGNGLVTMVHGSADPDPSDLGVPAPPAQEAFVAHRTGDSVILHVIPYDTDTARPANLSGDDPKLRIQRPGASDLEVEPNLDPETRPTCEEETSLEGHEGPIEACLVFEVPADEFTPQAAPTLVLTFANATYDGVEAYNAGAHVLLHDHIEGGPVPLEVADELTGQPTPFVVEGAAEPPAPALP